MIAGTLICTIPKNTGMLKKQIRFSGQRKDLYVLELLEFKRTNSANFMLIKLEIHFYADSRRLISLHG